MEKRELLFQKITPWFKLFYALSNLALAIYNIVLGRPYYYLLAFGGLLFLLVPSLLQKLFHLKTGGQFELMLFLFCYLLYTIGLVVHAYAFVPYYDKFAHTLSGVFVTLLGIGLFYVLKPVKKIEANDFGLVSVFSVAVSIAVAGLWEISEYFVSILFGTDPQNVLTTGIHDTMQDMIVCTIGSLILFVSMYFYYRRKKTSFLMGVFETFFHANYEHSHLRHKK